MSLVFQLDCNVITYYIHELITTINVQQFSNETTLGIKSMFPAFVE